MPKIVLDPAWLINGTAFAALTYIVTVVIPKLRRSARFLDIVLGDRESNIPSIFDRVSAMERTPTMSRELKEQDSK